MKKIFLPLFTLFMAFTVNAQNILTPKDDTANGIATDFDIIINGDFQNNGDADTFVWISTNVSITKGWGIAVCDNNQCYDTNIRSQKMYLKKNQKGNYDVHAYPYGNPGSAFTKVVIYRLSNMNDSAVNTYTFNAEAVSGIGSKKVKAASFEIYPNPSRDELNINFESNKTIEMKIFNVLGVEVMSHYHITSDSKLNVSQLQPGIYFIKFVDDNGKAYVKSFKKTN